MPQLSVQYEQGKGYEGMLASYTVRSVRSALGEWYNAGTIVLPFGRAVVAANTTGGIILPSAAGQTFKGITLLNDQQGQAESELLAGLAPGFLPKNPVSVLTFGDIWVYTEVAVNPGDAVYFRHTAGTAPNDVIGRFAKATSSSHDVVPNARYITKTTGAGLAIVNLGNT